MSEPRIERSANPQALAASAADWLLARALAKQDRFAICLSGGSTPKRLYELLATEPYRSRFPWAHSYWFLGDERFVPHDHPDSNYRMVKEALFGHVPVPPANIYPVPFAVNAHDAARDYEVLLKTFYGSEALDMTHPLFDVTFMGLGEDGHTASLFPGNPALNETRAWVIPVTDPSVKQERVTLTYPALSCSAAMAFLAEGSKKKAILKRVLAGDHSLPAARATAVGGVTWFVDEDAIA